MVEAYLLYFDMSLTKFKADMIKLNNDTNFDLDRELKHYLKSDGYDFLDYNDKIAIIVDDKGFEKKVNPVFELVCGYGFTHRLAGRLIFVRNIENEYSTDVGSITYEDIANLNRQLLIKLIGAIKAV